MEFPRRLFRAHTHFSNDAVGLLDSSSPSVPKPQVRVRIQYTRDTSYLLTSSDHEGSRNNNHQFDVQLCAVRPRKTDILCSYSLGALRTYRDPLCSTEELGYNSFASHYRGVLQMSRRYRYRPLSGRLVVL